jgi:hypothetical protein
MFSNGAVSGEGVITYKTG